MKCQKDANGTFSVPSANFPLFDFQYGPYPAACLAACKLI